MVEAIRQGDIPGVQARCRQELAAPIDAVWRWLSEPQLLGKWLAAEVRAEAGRTEVLVLKGRTEEGAELVEEATLLESASPRCRVLALRRTRPAWKVATRLTLELVERPAAAGGGAELSIFHEGFEHLPLSEGLTLWEAYRRRWRAALERLAERLAETRG